MAQDWKKGLQSEDAQIRAEAVKQIALSGRVGTNKNRQRAQVNFDIPQRFIVCDFHSSYHNLPPFEYPEFLPIPLSRQ